jgi:nucleotidyltransferase substrate binding protein (TIGR01987 family)
MTDYNQDVRWQQRFSNYKKAVEKLSKAVEALKDNISKKNNNVKDIDLLQREGLIQRFEYTHELAWNVIADYAKYQGYQDIKGSRDAVRYGLKANLISSNKWLNMIYDRNLTSHTYDDDNVYEIMIHIIQDYYPLFIDLEKTMENLIEEK